MDTGVEVSVEANRGVEYLGIEVTGSCEPPNMDSENQTWVL